MKLINYIGNENETGIYCIRNIINNKIYIGSTKTSFTVRKNRHLRELNNNSYCNEHLQNAWNKYSSDSFNFEILFICKPNECIKYEAEFIKLYSSNLRELGYNIACVVDYRFNYEISEIHNTEKKHRKKEKSKLVNGFDNKERGLPKPFKEYSLSGDYIREYNSAKEFTEINCVSIRGMLSTILNKRVLVYKNTIILFSNDVLTEKDIIFANKKIASKKVEIFDLNNKYIRTFDTVNESATFLNCKPCEVRMCCSGKRGRIRNFITKYIKNE